MGPLRESEIAVLRLVAQGFLLEEIATIRYLSRSSVRYAMRQVRKKLHASTTANAVLIAARLYPDLLPGPDEIAEHGMESGILLHKRYSTPLCDLCANPEPPRTTPPRQRRGEKPECGTYKCASWHARQGQRISELTCGCREAYAARHRDYYRARQARKASAEVPGQRIEWVRGKGGVKRARVL